MRHGFKICFEGQVGWVLQDMEKSGRINEKLVKAGEFWVKSGKRENEGKSGDLATLHRITIDWHSQLQLILKFLVWCLWVN